MFVTTSMPVGGAETLLVNLLRRMDRERFNPELCCLKDLGPLGRQMALEVPTVSQLLSSKFDVRVLGRLTRILRERRVDAVVTVGAGDKMFWGRLAAWRASVPVVCSALHSTGWPDGVGRLNRMLTRITDAFIGVAWGHGQHLVEVERFPAQKVHVITNGVDTDAFRPMPPPQELLAEFGLTADAPVAGVVAALRPEKNHELLLRAMRLVVNELPTARLLIVGEGPERSRIELLSRKLGLDESVRLTGSRPDIPALLSLFKVFTLTSHNEANPVSILEAMACGKPVVATRVGSVAETVLDRETGFLAPPGDARRIARHLLHLLRKPQLAQRMGQRGREAVVTGWSLDRMVAGYETLIADLYAAKCRANRPADQGLPWATAAR
jgi:glycosyltransferase involved in cell wall biosynthesis